MKKRIVISLALVFILAISLGFGINNRIYAEEPIGEVPSALADNEYATLEDFKAGFLSELHNHNENIVIRLRGTALTHPDISAIISEALRHNIDDPKGGDYIMQNITGGYNYHFEVGEDESGVYTELTFTTNFFTDAEMEREVDEAVAELLSDLDLSDKSDYQKIKAVYNWITENIVYDWDWDDESFDISHRHSTHAAIVSKKAVCQGISSLFYRLMLELDIDCRVITGVTGDENHAWNIVKLNGVYYNMDATWDLGLSDHYGYFLLTDSSFVEHDRDDFYKTEEFYAEYPMATVPYVEHVAASGSVNANIHWVLDADTGTLTISGTGAIPSYRFSEPPWYGYRTNVSRIVIEEGITEVGERSLYWCVNCTEVQLPTTLIAIREYGFNSLQSLEQITLPENLKIIEFCAFSECLALKSIVLPDSVTTVGPNVFSNCENLTSATLSAGMREVPDSMFSGDPKLSHVVIPEGITRISDTAFIMCGFTEFNIPSTVTGIGVASFSGCSKLTKITVAEGNPVYKDVDGVLFSKDGTRLICYPAAKTGSRYYIPEGTVVVDYGAFRGQTKLYSVTFPSSLIEIEGYAFSYCTKLDGLVFPETLLTIGTDAFRSCTLLTSVTFNNPDVELVGYTFAACSRLKSIDLPANLKAIPNGLFFGCKALESIEIPKTITSIGSSAFFDCDLLTDVVIPGNVKSIGQQAFDFCQLLSSITFEEGVTTLDWIAVRNAPNLSEVHLPASLRSIGKENFDNCPKLYVYVDCRSAGYSYVLNNGIRYKATHKYIPLSSYPSTCTQNGYTLYGCRCGYLDGYRSDFLPFAEHTYVSNTTPPTCTEQGYTTHTCSVCGDSYINNYVDATGHSYQNGMCTECGAASPEMTDWSGASVVFVGDSITYGTGTEKTYHSFIDEMGVFASVQSMGIAGSCISSKSDYGSGNSPLVARYTSIPDADLIVIFMGTNDYGHETPLGSPTDTTDVSFYGAMNIILSGIKTRHPNSRIVFVTPLHRYGFGTSKILGTKFTYDYIANGRGHSLDDYVNAIKAICEKYSVPVIDLFNEYPVDPSDSADKMTYMPDGLHPNTDGHEIISNLIFEKLKSIPRINGDDNDEENGSDTEDALLCYGNKFVSNYVDDTTRASSIVNLYLSKGQTVTFKLPGEYEWALAKTDSADSTVFSRYYPENGWNHVSSYTVTEDGYYGLVLKKCDGSTFNFENQDSENVFDYISVENPDEHRHSYIATVTPPTCTEQGYTTYTCHCGASYVEDYTDALGHNFGDWQSVTEPDCTEDGLERRDCTRCDHYETSVVSKTGHTYITVVTPPTCTEQGYTTYTCHCGDSYFDDYTDALGHTYITGVTPPTCTEQGYTTYTCRCGDSYVDNYTDPLGHLWNDGEIIRHPTTSSVGEMLYVCTVCRAEKREEIPMLEYETGDVNGEGGVSSSDAVYLLMHTFFPEEYPINQDGDFDNSGRVDSADAIYLLMYTFFPDEYPLAEPIRVTVEVSGRRKEDE